MSEINTRNVETLSNAIKALNEKSLKQEIRINELIELVSSMTRQLDEVKKIAIMSIVNKGNGATK